MSDVPEAFDQLPLGVRAKLLAAPHGVLPPDVLPALKDHVSQTTWSGEAESPFQLDFASALDSQRQELDHWWSGLSQDARADLVVSGEVPENAPARRSVAEAFIASKT